jgi:hypothetical protein
MTIALRERVRQLEEIEDSIGEQIDELFALKREATEERLRIECKLFRARQQIGEPLPCFVVGADGEDEPAIYEDEAQTMKREEQAS